MGPHDRAGVRGDRGVLRRTRNVFPAVAPGRRAAAERTRQCPCIMVHRIPVWAGHGADFRPGGAQRRRRGDRPRLPGDFSCLRRRRGAGRFERASLCRARRIHPRGRASRVRGAPAATRAKLPDGSAAAALTLVGLEGSRGRMDRQEFARRRRQFMRMIGKDAIAVLPAAPVRHRNGDIEYAYRQDSQFYYLSGFPEPDAVAVLAPGRPHAEYLLFVREHDALRESWDGAWAGPEGAVERYGADDAFPIADIDEILPGLMEQRSRIFYSMGHLEFDPRMVGWVNGMRVHARQGLGV